MQEMKIMNNDHDDARHPVHPFGPVVFAGITDKTRLKKK